MEKPPSPPISWLSTLKTNTKRKESNISPTLRMVWTFPYLKLLRSIVKRFGIESSYKLMNQARARTSTKKTCPTTAICRIRPPAGQHLDLHPLDTSQQTTTRRPPTTNLDLQNHVKTNHPKNRGKTRIPRRNIHLKIH